jgi:hypothetical protein
MHEFIVSVGKFIPELTLIIDSIIFLSVFCIQIQRPPQSKGKDLYCARSDAGNAGNCLPLYDRNEKNLLKG